MFRLVLVVLAALSVTACGQDRPDSGGGTLVTVYGEVGATDRGAIDDEAEPLFASYGIGFENAAAMSLDDLAALDQHSVEVRYPRSGGEHDFAGPYISDVLRAAEATGTHVTVTALDGYQRTIPVARLEEHGVLLALTMDGEPLGLGGYGPTMIVWPRDSDARLAGQDDTDWVWGVFAIHAHNR